MLGLSPDQQGFLIKTALASLVLLYLIGCGWLHTAYTVRGMLKRLRRHL